MLDWCMLVLYNRVNGAPHSRSKHVTFEICQVFCFQDKTSIFVFNCFEIKQKFETGLVLKILLKTKKLYFTQVEDDLSEKTSLATFRHILPHSRLNHVTLGNCWIFDFIIKIKISFLQCCVIKTKIGYSFTSEQLWETKKMCFTQFEGDLSESCQFDSTEVVRISHLY